MTDAQVYHMTFIIYLFRLLFTAKATYKKQRKQSCIPNKEINYKFPQMMIT